MLAAVWSGLGGKVADSWASLLLSPALAFWGGGLLLWVHAHGGLSGPSSGWSALDARWQHVFTESSDAALFALLVLALLLVAATARLAEALSLTVLRGLEGYWPAWAGPVRTAKIGLRGRRLAREAGRWRDLVLRRPDLSADEQFEFARLDARRAAVPSAPADRMPTALGDLLRAAESRPRHRYGLDAATCWPRLWLVLPEHVRGEVSAARAALDQSAQVWLAGLAFTVWTFVSWWALAVAGLGLVVGYRLARSAARPYAVLVQSCFDLYRPDLYAALGRVLPSDPGEERAAGRLITGYLQRGPDFGDER